MPRFADTHAATAICGGIGMPSQTEDQFLDSIDGELTADQVAKLMGFGDGDTDTQLSDEGSEPGATTGAASDDANTDAATDQGTDAATTGADAKSQEADKPTEAELNAQNAVILAKDGKHTISYDKLLEAREGEKNARALLAAQEQELVALRAAAQQRADAGQAPTKADNLSAAAEAAIEQGADASLFGDFSEEALAKGIETLVKQQVAALAPQVSAQVKQELAPIHQERAQKAADAHTNAIYAAHPDVDSVYESQEFANWVNSQPSYARSAIAGVLDPKTGGTAEQVVEIFDRFKQETGVKTAPAADTNTVKAAAAAAVAKAQAAPPASLSDIPGGRAGATSREEALAGMDGVQLISSMDDMTEEQIERFLNRL